LYKGANFIESVCGCVGWYPASAASQLSSLVSPPMLYIPICSVEYLFTYGIDHNENNLERLA